MIRLAVVRFCRWREAANRRSAARWARRWHVREGLIWRTDGKGVK